MASLTHRIEGSDLQFVEITLAAGEAVVGEPGAMMFADEAIEMDTRMGDGDDASFFDRIAAGFKRAFTGENFFSSVFTNNTNRTLRVAFAAPSPGKIVAVDLASIGGTLICQRGAFLGGTRGVRVGVAFKKRLRAGLFGGEGFVMQRISGNGTAFIHARGTLAQISLRAGESLKVDTGCLAALQTSVTYDVMYVGKLKTSILGGEGLFLAKLMGPGTVWLQSLPMQRLRASLLGASVAQSRGPGARMAYLFGVIIFTLIVLSRLP